MIRLQLQPPIPMKMIGNKKYHLLTRLFNKKCNQNPSLEDMAAHSTKVHEEPNIMSVSIAVNSRARGTR
jgi:hypothetical protein